MEVKPKWYNCRKWTTFTLCLFNILIVVSVILIVIQATGISVQNMKTSTTQKYSESDIKLMEDGWQLLKTILIVSAVIAVLVHVFGLVAVIKEHYHLVIAYAIIMAITTVISFVAKFVVAPIFLLLFAVNSAVMSFAFLFANEMRKQKRMNSANTMAPVCVSQPQTVIQVTGQIVVPQGVPMQMQALEWPGSHASPPPYDIDVTNIQQNYSMKA